jgi:hypothetical protein
MKAIIRKVLSEETRRKVREGMWIAKWAWPNPMSSPPAMSSRAATWLDIMKRDGIVQVDGQYGEVAEYINEMYFDKLERGEVPGRASLFCVDAGREKDTEYMQTMSRFISFRDKGIQPLIFDPDIGQLLCNYYRRKACYRNQPLIQRIDFRDGDRAPTNGSFHTDHLRQISLMLLVSDIGEHDIHMEYALGSHRRDIRQGIFLGPTEGDVLAKEYDAFCNCTGKKGTLYIFDASGVHRANYRTGSTRKILHMNITSGHNLRELVDIFDADLGGLPPYVANLVKREGFVSDTY